MFQTSLCNIKPRKHNVLLEEGRLISFFWGGPNLKRRNIRMKIGLPLPEELNKLIRELAIPAISADLKICNIFTALHRNDFNQTAEKLRGYIYAF